MRFSSYFISAVSYDSEHRFLISAIVHPNNNDTVGLGVPTPRQAIVGSLMRGYSYATILENKAQDNWNMGQRIELIQIGGVFYIKTILDNVEDDNLENLPEY